VLESIITLVVTTTLLLGSPGPTPMALAATGATFGIKKGTWFLLGILAGLMAVIIGATFGLAVLFSAWPQAKLSVQLLGALYILYIAFKIASAPVLDSHQKSSLSPPNFVDGFILNLLNPKAYASFLAIFSQFSLPFVNQTLGFIVTAIICLLVAAVVDTIWLCLGGALRPVFERPVHARVLRVVFALLMVTAVSFVIYDSENTSRDNLATGPSIV